MTHFHNTRREYKMADQKKKKKEIYKMKNFQTRPCLEVKMRAAIFF